MKLQKHKSILQLLDRLNLDERGWAINDHWEADMVAIGIATAENPNHLVYIGTFGLPEGLYNYDCETPTGPDPTDYAEIDSGEEVGFDELLAAMERHLSNGRTSASGQTGTSAAHGNDSSKLVRAKVGRYMNLRKDVNLIHLLKKLKLEERGWIASGDWKVELCAVEVIAAKNPDRIVYISTFYKQNGLYDFDCTIRTGPKSLDFQVTDDGEDVSYDELLAAMEKHLG